MVSVREPGDLSRSCPAWDLPFWAGHFLALILRDANSSNLPTRENMNEILPGSTSDVEDLPRVSTGSAGLDDILGGGFDGNRLYLYEGHPGTGKTTIALQFLL